MSFDFEKLERLGDKASRIITFPLTGGRIKDKTHRKLRLADPLGLFTSKDIQLPKAPTIDEASKNRDEFDRIRRRRGILATIFSNNASSTPAVATQQLLG